MILLLIIAFILDFIAASESKEKNNASARDLALAAAWLTIIGTILVAIGLVILTVTNIALSSKFATQLVGTATKLAPFIAE